MADFYCDLSAPGNEYQAYADAMTWGALVGDKPLPQDGNGKAGPGHAAAVAIAEVQITVLPADTNTLTIAGATVTAKTTAAAKNQWTIGASIAACVTNLVALLNTFGTGVAQCDAAASTSASALALALPYFVYARVKPGATDTLQIATRFAGTTLNHATNSAVAIASSGWATPPTITQFAGGADGPFAYLLNTATVFGKSAGLTGTAGPGYGLFFAAAGGPNNPGAGDVVHVRTRRSGANFTVTWNSTGTPTGTWATRNYLFDDGTIWSGDSGKLTTVFKNSSGSSVTSQFNVAASSVVTMVSRSKYGFEMQAGVTASGSGTWLVFGMANGSRLVYKHCRFVETSDSLQPRTIQMVADVGTATIALDFVDSYAQFRTTAKTIAAANASSTNVRYNLSGSTVEVVAASGTIGAAINITNAGVLGNVDWVGGEIKDSLGVFRCTNPYTVPNTATMDLLIDGVVGVVDPAVGWSPSLSAKGRLRWVSPEGPNKGFRYEVPQYSIDWRGDGTFPYAGAAADLRGVNWSHRVTWHSIPGYANSVTPFKFNRFHRAASAVRTLTIELYVPNATTIYQDELELTVSYLDSTDVWRNESVGGLRGLQFGASRTALAASSASWTANGVASYSAKKIELTTSQPVKTGSEVIARLSLVTSRGSSIVIYASPEPGLA